MRVVTAAFKYFQKNSMLKFVIATSSSHPHAEVRKLNSRSARDQPAVVAPVCSECMQLYTIAIPAIDRFSCVRAEVKLKN